jgi:EAL domain-containing protein (putative c-di-GMP-specific phosphodiesterase class I)
LSPPLERLAASGVSIALDDFGTGYSSLEHLRNFTFRTLKMDRSFVAALTTDDRAAAVARGLINLAHELDLTVTAEGVETAEQLEFLEVHRCDRIQGFYTSRPLDPTAFAELLSKDASLYPKRTGRATQLLKLANATVA